MSRKKRQNKKRASARKRKRQTQRASSLVIPIIVGVVVVTVIVGTIVSIESRRPVTASVPMVTAAAQPTNPIPYPGVPRISIEEAREKLETGQAVVVDVRTKNTYDQAHLPGSISLPEDEIEARLDELPHNKELILYCA